MKNIQGCEKYLKLNKKNLMAEQRLITDQTTHLINSVGKNQDDLIKLLKDKETKEIENLENLQKRFYGETVKMANLEEDIDNIRDFILDFSQQAAATSKKRQGHVNVKSFRTLNETDQESINELLASQEINFR